MSSDVLSSPSSFFYHTALRGVRLTLTESSGTVNEAPRENRSNIRISPSSVLTRGSGPPRDSRASGRLRSLPRPSMGALPRYRRRRFGSALAGKRKETIIRAAGPAARATSPLRLRLKRRPGPSTGSSFCAAKRTWLTLLDVVSRSSSPPRTLSAPPAASRSLALDASFDQVLFASD